MVKNCFWCNKRLDKKRNHIFCKYCFSFDQNNSFSVHRCSWFVNDNINGYDIQLIEPKTNFMLYQFGFPTSLYIKDLNNNVEILYQNYTDQKILTPEFAYNILMATVKLKCLI